MYKDIIDLVLNGVSIIVAYMILKPLCKQINMSLKDLVEYLKGLIAVVLVILIILITYWKVMFPPIIL